MTRMAQVTGPEGAYTIEALRIGDIQVPEYQRGQKRTAGVVQRKFDPRLMAPITVSRREDGSLWMIDGYQRKLGVESRKEGPREDMIVPACVYSNLSVEEEVYIFEKLNRETVKVSPYDIFKAQLVAAEPEAVAISKIAASRGLAISASHSSTSVGSIALLRTIYRWKDNAANDRNHIGEWILSDALQVARLTWGGISGSFSGSIIGGISLLLRRLYFEGYFTDPPWKGEHDLARKIAAFPQTRTPDLVMGNISGPGVYGSRGAVRSAGQLFTAAWNYKRTTYRLDDTKRQDLNELEQT